jgi:photosystem II stability/assembly factor-like uncharacterized protein
MIEKKIRSMWSVLYNFVVMISLMAMLTMTSYCSNPNIGNQDGEIIADSGSNIDIKGIEQTTAESYAELITSDELFASEPIPELRPEPVPELRPEPIPELEPELMQQPDIPESLGDDIGEPYAPDVVIEHSADIAPKNDWKTIATNVSSDLKSVACRNGHIWAVGDNSTIIYSQDGQSFSAQNAPIQINLSSVAFVNAQRGVAVGDTTIIATADGGTTWSPSWFCAVIGMSIYHKIILVSDEEGYAIGQSNSNEGTFKYQIPNGWNCFTAQTWPNYTLYTAASIGPKQFFMTGDTGGHILKTENMTTWKTINSGIKGVFLGMTFRDAKTGWVVGKDGLVIRTDDSGENWRRLAIGLTTNTLRAIAFASSGSIVAVGDSGTVIVSTDGGETFNLMLGTGSTQLNDICFSDKTAYVVGEAGFMMQRSF